MSTEQIRATWEAAAPGWARWESKIQAWMEPATTAMITMARIAPGARVLDVASGAGSQTLRAAQVVGRGGAVLATDIAQAMLSHVLEKVRAEGHQQVTTLACAAESLDLDAEAFDAAICQLGVMLFAQPNKALAAIKRALRLGGRFAGVVFTSPAANPFMAGPMAILLRRAGKQPPAPEQPGLFALGAPGRFRALLEETGFRAIEERILSVPLRLTTAADGLAMIQDAFGAYRAVVSDLPEAARLDAWQEVGAALRAFETADGFVAGGEVLVVSAAK